MQPWEEKYDEVAAFMHIDPSTVDYIPFNATDPVYMDAWLHLVLKPIADQGIDVWWLDWQQGEKELSPNVNPTFWLNYLFFTDPAMWGKEKDSSRPMILHRWGGMGNHRMQLGFSGDVEPNWDSLNFQLYFTTTAANVLYGYWSHDIGGMSLLLSPPSSLASLQLSIVDLTVNIFTKHIPTILSKLGCCFCFLNCIPRSHCHPLA